MIPVAMAQNTENLRWFVQEAEQGGATLDFDDVQVKVVYRHRKSDARWMVVHLNKTDFVVLGTGFDVRFWKGTGGAIPLTRVERGKFKGETWQPLLPVRRESEDRSAPFRVIEAQVTKVTLDLQEQRRMLTSVMTSDSAVSWLLTAESRSHLP